MYTEKRNNRKLDGDNEEEPDNTSVDDAMCRNTRVHRMNVIGYPSSKCTPTTTHNGAFYQSCHSPLLNKGVLSPIPTSLSAVPALGRSTDPSELRLDLPQPNQW